MIPQKTINEENYSGYSIELDEVLDSIPMTTEQRQNVRDYLDRMENVFREANK